jgi:hypothetical protein
LNASIKKGRKSFCSLSCSTSHRNQTTNNEHNLKLPQNQKGYKQRKDTRFTWYINRSRSRKKNNGLTSEVLRLLWEKQKGLCAISNIPLFLHDDCVDNRYLASLDRIDSSLSYQDDNIQFIALPLNLAKQSLHNDKFISFMREVAQNMSS